jgi:hypothetical protein
MVIVKAAWDLLRNHMVSAAIVAVCPVLVWLAISQEARWPLYLLVAATALAVGIYVGLRHPLWLFWGLAFILGAIPFGYFPGVHLPMYLAFAGGALLATLIHRSERTTLSRMEVAVIVFVLVCALSVAATGRTLADLVEFTKWAMCTVVVIALLRLSPANMCRFGRIFVLAATANALFGIAIVLADPQQRFIRVLKPFGYGEGEGLRGKTALYVYTDEGRTLGQSIRLGGTWVLPNTAGVALVCALALCIILFNGWTRNCIAAILIAATMLTLSRSAVFTLVVAVALVLMFATMRARDRQSALGVIAVIACVALIIPVIRNRIFSSFDREDYGTVVRGDAIRELPGHMSGHWVFGLGWGRPEFKDGSVAEAMNLVSNAPLLTVYRAGVIAGLAFLVVLILGCVMAYRALRSGSLPFALYGGIFIGLCVVAFQLDKTVVNISAITITFSVLLAFLVHIDEARALPQQAPTPAQNLLASTAS